MPARRKSPLLETKQFDLGKFLLAADRILHECREQMADAFRDAETGVADYIMIPHQAVKLLGPEWFADEFHEVLVRLLPKAARPRHTPAITAQVLDRLCADKIIELVRPAAGKRPAQYRAKKRRRWRIRKAQP